MKYVITLTFVLIHFWGCAQNQDSITPTPKTTAFIQIAHQYVGDTYYNSVTTSFEYFKKYGKQTYDANRAMPALGVGISQSLKIGNIPFMLEHFVGVQSSSQDYTFYEVTNDSVGQNGWQYYDQVNSTWDVKKYFGVYMLSAKFSTNPHVNIGPQVLIERLIGHSLKAKSVGQTSWSFENGNGKLKQHSKYNLKFGAQIGVKLFNRYTLGLNTLCGVNKSILLSPKEYFYSQQVGLFLNINLIQ